MNVIKVTGNNRKAVLAFLEEVMPTGNRPSDKLDIHMISDCISFLHIDDEGWYITFDYNGELTTLKAVKALYKPKETKAEKTQRSRAMMYKLKYEQLRRELSNVNKLNESQYIQIETLSNSLVDIEASNKHLQKQLDTNQSLYMKERETTTHLTQKFEASEIEVEHLKREKKGLIDENVYLYSEVARYRGISTRENANKIQSELIYEQLLSQHKSLNGRCKRYKIAFYLSCAVVILTPIILKWIG